MRLCDHLRAFGGVCFDAEVRDKFLEIGVVVLEIILWVCIDADVEGFGVGHDGQAKVFAAEHLFEPLRPFEV